MKNNYFAELEKRARLNEEAYVRVKKEVSELRKELYPPITTNPLLTLVVDNFGRKLYTEIGRIAEISPNQILLKENVYFRNFIT